MIIFNEELNDIISIRHICFYTAQEGDTIILKEVIEKELKHPIEKDLASIYKIDTRIVTSYRRRQIEAAQINIPETESY